MGVLEELRRLNFRELIEIDTDNPCNYSFNDYVSNGKEHKVKGYCTSCEDKGLNKANDNDEYKLTNISHAAHSIDFLESLKTGKLDISQWNDSPIIFLFESPSLDYGIYQKCPLPGLIYKRPSKEWYWVHEPQENAYEYPNYFKGKEYGRLIFSLINTFKLKNVYITNLIKCSLNNAEGKYLGIGHYNPMCVTNCFEKFLSKEIELMKPKIIFSIGSSVDFYINSLLKNSLLKNSEIKIINLPHPAGARRGFKDSFYRTLFFWLVVEGLYQAGIISKTEIQEYALKFVSY